MLDQYSLIIDKILTQSHMFIRYYNYILLSKVLLIENFM